MSCFCSTYRKKGGFRRGEKTGQNKQKNQYDNLVYHDTYGAYNTIKNEQLNPFHCGVYPENIC
jgi:hypothetical protein